MHDDIGILVMLDQPATQLLYRFLFFVKSIEQPIFKCLNTERRFDAHLKCSIERN